LSRAWDAGPGRRCSDRPRMDASLAPGCSRRLLPPAIGDCRRYLARGASAKGRLILQCRSPTIQGELASKRKFRSGSTTNSRIWRFAYVNYALPRISELLGFKLIAVDPVAGTLNAEFQGAPQFMNAGGTIQGGIITAMLDDVMSYAGTAFLDGTHMLPTLEIKTIFIRPAPVGPLFGAGRLVHRGRDFTFLEGVLKGDGDRLLASATATARILPIPSQKE
jgi:uncharacterized protein (TIGR00369 family)